MAETLTTPRITSPYLNSFTSRTVRMVGKVTQLRGDEATIESDGAVTVILNRVCSISRLFPPLDLYISHFQIFPPRLSHILSPPQKHNQPPTKTLKLKKPPGLPSPSRQRRRNRRESKPRPKRQSTKSH